MDFSTIISFVTGLGAGSVITAIMQHQLSRVAKRQDNLFNERKSAFDRFLVAYAALATEWSDSKAKDFALCEARIQLVASETTVIALQNLKASDPGSTRREDAHRKLIQSMRKDLSLA